MVTCGLQDSTLTCNTTEHGQFKSLQLYVRYAKECLGTSCAANLSAFSSLLYCEFQSKMPKIALAPLTADIQMCFPPPPPAVYTPQSLESNQSDTAICARVKESDYYTVDSSSWIRARLTTVSSNHESLNQNKHLGSIIPCWKPLIVNFAIHLEQS